MDLLSEPNNSEDKLTARFLESTFEIYEKDDQAECQKTYLQLQIKNKNKCRKLMFGKNIVCSIKLLNMNILVVSCSVWTNTGGYD